MNKFSSKNIKPLDFIVTKCYNKNVTMCYKQLAVILGRYLYVM